MKASLGVALKIISVSLTIVFSVLALIFLSWSYSNQEIVLGVLAVMIAVVAIHFAYWNIVTSVAIKTVRDRVLDDLKIRQPQNSILIKEQHMARIRRTLIIYGPAVLIGVMIFLLLSQTYEKSVLLYVMPETVMKIFGAI